jgi:hypothetical protein
LSGKGVDHPTRWSSPEAQERRWMGALMPLLKPEVVTKSPVLCRVTSDRCVGWRFVHRHLNTNISKSTLKPHCRTYSLPCRHLRCPSLPSVCHLSPPPMSHLKLALSIVLSRSGPIPSTSEVSSHASHRAVRAPWLTPPPPPPPPFGPNPTRGFLVITADHQGGDHYRMA